MTVRERQWRQSPDVAWTGNSSRVIASRTAALDRAGPTILEGAAAWIWLAIGHPITTSELVGLAIDATGADPDRVQIDTAHVLAELNEAGLVEQLPS